MLRALIARLRMWLDALIEFVGPRRWQTRICAACRRQIPKRALKCPYCGAWLAWGER
jgi:ribosomal protein L40E